MILSQKRSVAGSLISCCKKLCSFQIYFAFLQIVAEENNQIVGAALLSIKNYDHNDQLKISELLFLILLLLLIYIDRMV